MIPPCPICNSSKIQPFLKRENGAIWRCQRCDCRFVFPQPSPQIWPDFYGQSYFKKKAIITGYPDYQAQRELYLAYFKKKLRELKKLLPPREKLRVLDVGCAFGLFLELCQKEGFEVYGLDISEFAVKQANKFLKGRIYLGTLETVTFPSSFFDIVTCFQTIEHFPNPLGSLKIIKKILKPGGFLLVTTPDPQSLLARLLYKKWHGWYAKAHLFHFSKKSFFNLLRQAGFFEIRIKKDDSTIVSLKDILQGIEGHYPSSLAQGWKIFLQLFSDKFQRKRFLPLFFMKGLSATCKPRKIEASK